MRHLHVIHRIFIGLRQRHIHIEHEFRIRFTRDQEEAHGVAAFHDVAGARPFDQVPHRHIRPGTFGDFDFLTVFHDGDHFVQHVVRIALRNTDVQCLQASAYTGDGAVVIAALNIDRLLIAAFPFGHVVSHIRYEVSVSTVRLTHHAVFIIFVLGGAQPQRAVLLIGFTGSDQCIHGTFDFTVGVQRGFQIISIELHAECLQIGILFAAQIRNRECADRVDIIHIAGRRDWQTIAGGGGFLRQKIFCDFSDVITVVSRFRPAGFTRFETFGTCLYRQCQIADLYAGIVVIELAADRKTLRIQQCGQGITERRLTAVTYVQRTGRVRGHKFHHHFFTGTALAAAIGAALTQNDLCHRLFSGSADAQIDETRTGDFDGGNHRMLLCQDAVSNLLSDFTRIFAQRFGDLHRDITSGIAVRRIARTFERDHRLQFGTGQQRCHRCL